MEHVHSVCYSGKDTKDVCFKDSASEVYLSSITREDQKAKSDHIDWFCDWEIEWAWELTPFDFSSEKASRCDEYACAKDSDSKDN